MTDLICGRIHKIRNLGGIIFVDLFMGYEKQTIVCRKDLLPREDFFSIKKLRKGDFIQLYCNSNSEAVGLDKYIHSNNNSFISDNQSLLVIKYSNLLKKIRKWLNNHSFIEVRLPSIHFGKTSDHVFNVDFFGLNSRLSSSGSLYLNVFASHLVKVFSLQKCFRAEPSKTSRHLAEYDLLEVAMLGCNMNEIMKILENMIYDIWTEIKDENTIKEHKSDISLPFPRVNYKNIAVRYGISGMGLGKYERTISKDGPIFITDFPIKIASWSAKPIDESYSRSFNLLLPQVGEVAGGNQKQTNVDLLKRKFEILGLMSQLGWYCKGLNCSGIDLSGFGLGVERLAMWLFGLKNIRNLNPFYRDQSFSEITQ